MNSLPTQFDSQTIGRLIAGAARRAPSSIAFLAHHRAPLTYAGLATQADRVRRVLTNSGIAPRDRVAISLPDGPDLATAFVTIAACCAAAPLNPRYQREELEFYFVDLKAKAVVVPAGLDCPARRVAQSRGLGVFELSTSPNGHAGEIILAPGGYGSGNPAGAGSVLPVSIPSDPRANPALTPEEDAQTDDVALLLHTSGTTSRPKLVPLTHRNLCASAANISATLRLTAHDRCLNVMPLFHIHGLVGTLLATIAAGASIVFLPGFEADGFFHHLQEFQPTWYSAVPTIHQEILALAPRWPEVVQHNTLRFIRSSSAALPPSLLEALERAFHTVVIEAYGMTEAAHQMASNPLPPGERLPGSVGLAAGPDVSVIDENWIPVRPGIVGEIAIRGSTVTAGYEGNDAANQVAFRQGWFRTGDQGRLDERGYLAITGRTKEMIKRGGENIAPREIDEALLEHPAVRQAVAFATPHRRLGEDVIVAAVLRAGANATERDLRDFLMSKLAGHKVPSRVVLVPHIPKGPTGKVQRVSMFAQLGDLLQNAFEHPRTTGEKTLAAIWGELFDSQEVSAADNFFQVGGDSLLAARLASRIQDTFDVRFTAADVFKTPVLRDQAHSIESRIIEQIVQ